MTETSTEPGNPRKRTLGGKGKSKEQRPSASRILGAAPKTPAYHEVPGTLQPEKPGEDSSTPETASATTTLPDTSQKKSQPASPLVTPARDQPSTLTPDSSQTGPKNDQSPQPHPQLRPPSTLSSHHVMRADNEDGAHNDDNDSTVDGYDGETVHRVSVYLSQAAALAARRTELVRGALAIEAVEAAMERGVLPLLIKIRGGGVKKQGSRFPARTHSRRVTKPARGVSTRTLWQPSFTAEEIRVLDEILDEVGAESRSQLISVAVEWYLAQGEAQSRTRTDSEQNGVVNLDPR